MYYYFNKHDFFITSREHHSDDFLIELKKGEETAFLFGYCISSDFYSRNQTLSASQFRYIQENNIDISGIYCALSLIDGKATIVIDPLCQFNIFYAVIDGEFVVTSSIEFFKKFGYNMEVNEEYLYDQLAYQSPMRGKTILKGVYYVQFDDIAEFQEHHDDLKFIINSDKICIQKPDFNKYDHLSYDDLLVLYTMRLKSRARLITSIFDDVHLQLTGGADSRLSLSAFEDKSKVQCYVYGDGTSQNRLIFEHILRARNVASVSEICLVGHPLNNTSKIFKGLVDSNFLKTNNLNTYMNGYLETQKKVCKITGYYGANVCGGVVLPPDETEKNQRICDIPSKNFKYHDYVEDFSNRHSGYRSSSFNDMFYINNRGKGHYAAHSLADNKNIPSIDILYDYLNLLLVKECPYSDWHIDKNAISIDLIYENDHQLALFPYDSRKIPKYRAFDEIPLINCFEGYTFPQQEVVQFVSKKPRASFEEYDFLKLGGNYMSMSDIFNLPELTRLRNKYPHLEYLVERNDIQANIYLYYLLGELFFSNL